MELIYDGFPTLCERVSWKGMRNQSNQIINKFKILQIFKKLIEKKIRDKFEVDLKQKIEILGNKGSTPRFLGNHNFWPET